MYDTTPEQEMKETVADASRREREKIGFYRANVDSFCRFIFVELIIERFECR